MTKPISFWGEAIEQLQLQTHTGVYMHRKGPSLETTAEYRMAHLLDLICVHDSGSYSTTGLKTNVCSIVSNAFSNSKNPKQASSDIVNADICSVQVNFIEVFQLFS